MTDPTPESSTVNRVTQAAQDLIAALQDLAKEQIAALPAHVQETLKQTVASLEKVMADLQTNTTTVVSQSKEQVKELEGRLAKAWEVLSTPTPADPPSE